MIQIKRISADFFLCYFATFFNIVDFFLPRITRISTNCLSTNNTNFVFRENFNPFSFFVADLKKGCTFAV